RRPSPDFNTARSPYGPLQEMLDLILFGERIDMKMALKKLERHRLRALDILAASFVVLVQDAIDMASFDLGNRRAFAPADNLPGGIAHRRRLVHCGFRARAAFRRDPI